MKIIHKVYNDLINIENIFNAWKVFKLGKSRKKEVIMFKHNLEDNLFTLQNELKQLKYEHGDYEKFIVNDPKKRIIHKAKIKDRIVQTVVAKKLEKIYQPLFISSSYSCQKSKGIHKALFDLVKVSRKLSNNYNQNFWYLKCDVQKFFDNIDQVILLNILKKKIKDDKFLWLIEVIIRSFYKAQSGKGLPLGNFTSQWLANIYLNELDYYIKHNLRIRYYLRYADDLLILDKNKEKLLKHFKLINNFLNNNLKLKLHPQKTIIKKFSSGIKFVGYNVLPHYVLLRENIKKRMFQQLNIKKLGLLKGEIGYWQYYESLNSYLGWLKHSNSYKLTNKIIYK